MEVQSALAEYKQAVVKKHKKPIVDDDYSSQSDGGIDDCDSADSTGSESESDDTSSDDE